MLHGDMESVGERKTRNEELEGGPWKGGIGVWKEELVGSICGRSPSE